MVNYPNAHIYLRFGGHMGGTSTIGGEGWSAGIRFAIVGTDVPIDAPALQTFVESAHAVTKTFHLASGTLAGTSAWLDWSTAARIGPDGHYSPLTSLTARKDDTPAIGTGTTVLPWSTAGVISLRTMYPRGYASNGRIYYPMTGAPIDPTTGRWNSTQMTNRLAAAKIWINALNTAASVYAINMKAAVLSGVGSGKAALVSGLRSDERLDSIENRENYAPSTWTTVTIP